MLILKLVNRTFTMTAKVNPALLPGYKLEHHAATLHPERAADNTRQMLHPQQPWVNSHEIEAGWLV